MSNENGGSKVHRGEGAGNTAPANPTDKKKPEEKGKITEAVAAFGVFAGEAILFTGLVGVAILFLGLIMDLGLGIWAIPAAVAVGSGLKMLSDYVVKRANNQTEKFSPLGAVLGYPVAA